MSYFSKSNDVQTCLINYLFEVFADYDNGFNFFDIMYSLHRCDFRISAKSAPLLCYSTETQKLTRTCHWFDI